MWSVWPSWGSSLDVRLVRPVSVRMIRSPGHPDGYIPHPGVRVRDGAGGWFADTVGNFHGSGIDALAPSGITGGCATDPLRYCHGEAVTRAQMATFLARVLGLVPLPEMVAPEAPRLAYTQVSGAVSSVIVVDADGSDSRSLGTGASGPVWSPDGTRILYRGVPWPDQGGLAE